MDEYKIVQLTQGAVAKVSPEDLEMVNEHKWHLTSNGYAARTDYPSGARIYLHRVINHTPKGIRTDHEDRDKLNCMRSNLRTATPSQNGQNSGKQSRPLSSIFKGVSFRPARGNGKTGCWAAHIKYDGKKQHLGHYVTEFDAGWRYNIEAQRVFGEFAKLNDIPLDFMASKPAPEIFKEKGHSQYRGVSFSKSMQSWFAYVTKNGKRVHTSYHATELDACIAYNAAAAAHHGPTSRLNQL